MLQSFIFIFIFILKIINLYTGAREREIPRPRLICRLTAQIHANQPKPEGVSRSAGSIVSMLQFAAAPILSVFDTVLALDAEGRTIEVVEEFSPASITL
jgi:hypothetical protein